MPAQLNLSDSKPTPLLSLVWKLQQSVDELLMVSAGVGLSSTRILAVLDNAVPRSQKQIAIGLKQTEANISRQIRIMADQGLVKIAPNKKDHRQRDVTLTSKGVRVYNQAERLLQKHQAYAYKSFQGSEKESFESLVDKILRTL